MYHLDRGEPSEQSLIQDLNEDLQDAWHRLREVACEFGEQRIYASHRSIMFSRKTCHFFVRPRTTSLELCFFLARTVTDPLVRKTEPVSRVKTAHTVLLVHRDQIGRPLTDWLLEAYGLSDGSLKPAPSRVAKPRAAKKKTARASAKKKPSTKRATRKKARRKTRRSESRRSG